MIIQHNMNSMNSRGNLEKLSSVRRINSSDDAAGLNISDKMRSQIRGLTAQVRDAYGIGNYIQTGDSALGEIESILRHGKELATRSANGFYDKLSDRAAVEREWQQLCNEIDNVSRTEFNGCQIFDTNNGQRADTPNSSIIMLQTADRGDIPVTVYNDSLEETIAQVVNVPEKNFTKEALTIFSERMRNKFLPRVLGRIVDALPESSIPTVRGMKIGYKLYDGDRNVAAYVSSNGTVFQLAINVHFLEMENGMIMPSSMLAWTITHEMTHAIMFDTLSIGMSGYTSDGNKVTRFPNWFIEGMAESVAGGIIRLDEIFPLYIECQEYYEDEDALENENFITDYGWVKSGKHRWERRDDIFKAFTSKLQSQISTTSTWYSQGYAACMFMGYIAANNTNAVASVDGDRIAQGLDRILCELASGKSLNRVMKEKTGMDIDTFVHYFASGDSYVIKFLKGLMSASNARYVLKKNTFYYNEHGDNIGCGGIATFPKLSAPFTSLLDCDYTDNFFILDLEKQVADNADALKKSGKVSYEGGSADKDFTDRRGNTPSPSVGAGAQNPVETVTPKPQDIKRTEDLYRFNLKYSSDKLGGLKNDLNCSIYGLGLNSIKLTTQNDAIDKISFALEKVVAIRGVFAAIQNRLENEPANFKNLIDPNMMNEAVSSNKFNIVHQASMAMLAQSNQHSRGSLDLLG